MAKTLIYISSSIIGAAVLYGGIAGKKIMFVSDPRSAVIVLTIVGFLMCSLGSKGAFITGAPLHPLTITGYVLGALALFTGIVQIFKFNVPFISGSRNVLFIITTVIVIKFIIARLGFLLNNP